MNTQEIKIGSMVTAPVTDADGEVEYVIGKLVDMNKRYAKVEVDGNVLSIGKTKIELIEAPKRNKVPKNSKPAITCPVCGSVDIIGNENGKTDKLCHDCGCEFGIVSSRIANNYNYHQVKAASGRASVDNNDKVAQLLRGKTLDDAYEITAETIGAEVKTLIARYNHLNPGHQRMCLGNLLRGHFNK